MSLLTNWGYTLTGQDTLEPMLSKEDFDTYSGGKYARQSDRINAEISAACTAIRNYVGWHLYPSAQCRCDMTVQDRRITRVGPDLLIQLPSKYVTEVAAATVDLVSREFSVEPNGILRIYDVPAARRFAPVTVSYTAGLPDALMDPIKELIAHRVTHSVAVPSGITSEASGGVSVTYNASWINSAQSTTLQDTNKELLAPYRVQGVF